MKKKRVLKTQERKVIKQINVKNLLYKEIKNHIDPKYFLKLITLHELNKSSKQVHKSINRIFNSIIKNSVSLLDNYILSNDILLKTVLENSDLYSRHGKYMPLEELNISPLTRAVYVFKISYLIKSKLGVINEKA